MCSCQILMQPGASLQQRAFRYQSPSHTPSLTALRARFRPHPDMRLPTPHSSPLCTGAKRETRLSTGPPFRLPPTRSSVQSWIHEPGTCCRHRCLTDTKEPSTFARHRAHHARHCSCSPTASRRVNSLGNMERGCPRPNPCSECIPTTPSTVRRT